MKWQIALVFEVTVNTDEEAYAAGEKLVDQMTERVADSIFLSIDTREEALRTRLGPVTRQNGTSRPEAE